MIVVDTNLLVQLQVQGRQTTEAEAVLQRDPTWSAPLLWRSEFRNTMLGFVRHDMMTLETALRVIHQAERWMAGREYGVVSHHVLHLAVTSGCSAYDCEFVCLAQDLGTALITSDRQILRAFPNLAHTPAQFLAGSRHS
jgi:predicted nucleic acid-binding protein